MAHSGDGGFAAEEPCPARLCPTSAKWPPVQAQSATVSGPRQARTANGTAAGPSADGDAEGGQYRLSVRDRGLLAWHAAALSRMNALCANGTTGVDILLPYEIASVDASNGREAADGRREGMRRIAGVRGPQGKGWCPPETGSICAARYALVQSASISSGRPPLGRVVKLISSSMRWPGTVLKRKSRTSVARIAVISSVANPMPMQMRGPAPKGR